MSDSPSVGTRLLAAIGGCIVIAFSAIIAGVPINLPSNQHDTFYVAAGTPGTPSHGDTAWQIVATAMIMALSPALAFLYGTLNGSNIMDLLKTVMIVSSMITFLWILFSFSLAYGKDAKDNGIIGYPGTFYFFHDTFDQGAYQNGAGALPNSIFAVYELGFALITATLVSISLAGRVNLNSFLLFMFSWHLIVYTPIAHIVWSPAGAIFTNWVQDFSGGLVVNVLASATAIALHLVLGKDEIPKAGAVANPEKALYLTFVVFFLWFGFNAGKAHSADPVACQSVVNTIASVMSAVLMSFFYNLVLEKPITAVSLSNAVLIGLVAITPGSGMVTVGGAMCISVFTYLFTAIVAQFFIGEGFNAHESFSTLTIHSVAGSVGFLWTAIISYSYINPGFAYNGLTAGRGIPLAYQISALLAIWAGAFISSFFLGWVINLVSPLKNTGAYGDEYSKGAEAESTDMQKGETGVELTNQV